MQRHTILESYETGAAPFSIKSNQFYPTSSIKEQHMPYAKDISTTYLLIKT